MAEKKKKKEIEYDIDPSLPEEEQRRLRKQIRAERRKEREDRRRRREGLPVDDGPALVSPPDSARDDRSEEASSPKKGTAAWEWRQKEEEERRKREEEERKKREDDKKKVLDDNAAPSARSAMAVVREKERQQLEQQKLADEARRRELDEEALKEKRRLDKAARERKAQEEEERRKDEETRAQKAQLDAAKREREAKELAAKEAKLREENARRREEEEKQRAEEEAQRRRRDEVVRKQQEEERRERERREAERAAERARERAEYEARREEQRKRYQEENERAAREHMLQLSVREREELMRLEEERSRTRLMRERSKQTWAEQVRAAEERVRNRGEQELDAVHRAEDESSSRKANAAGKETDEFLGNAVAAKSFVALGSLLRLAVRAGCTQQVLSRPSWVLVGAKSRAKSNVLDALLGFPVFRGIDVVRLFYIELVYDAEAELSPVAFFDGLSSSRVDVFRLPAEMAQRNIPDSAEPCRVTVRFKHFWDMMFVVTPDLPEPILPAVYDPERWPVVMSELTPPERMVLWIDRCDAEPPFGAQFARMLKIVDAKHRRSLLVLNGLSDVLADYTLASEANNLLSQPCAVPAFFVSYSTDKVSASDLASRMTSDEATLKRLGAFDSLRSRVGVKAFAREVQRLTKQSYDRNVLPAALAHLQGRATQVGQARSTLDRHLEGLQQPHQLREFAARRVMEYLQLFRAALRGEEGLPNVHGETLQDEREQSGQPREAWRVSPRLLVSVPASSVSQSNVRLLGNAAMQRLLADLSSAAAQAGPSLSEELSGASRALLGNTGPAGSGRLPDFMSAASDVAAKRAREMLRPLASAAVTRAVRIAQKVADAAETALGEHQRSKQSDIITHAPFFWAAIRERVYEFIDAHAQSCNQAVEDAFRATAFLPVSLLKQLSPMLPKDEAEELERLNAMSNGILDELKVRLLEATRLALMEHVLEPLDEKVQTFVASRMSELPIEDVEAALQPEAVRARLLEEKCRLEQEAVLVSECVRIFEGHAQDFTNESF